MPRTWRHYANYPQFQKKHRECYANYDKPYRKIHRLWKDWKKNRSLVCKECNEI